MSTKQEMTSNTQNQPLKASIQECLSTSNHFQDLLKLVKHQEKLSKASDGMQTNIES